MVVTHSKSHVHKSLSTEATMLPSLLLVADELGLGVDTAGENDGMTSLLPVAE